MTSFSMYSPLEENVDDDGFLVVPGQIRVVIEGQALHWTPEEAREAARRLLLMADEAERESE